MPLKTQTVLGLASCALAVVLPVLGYALSLTEVRGLVTVGILTVTFAPLLTLVLGAAGLVLLAPEALQRMRAVGKGRRPDA